LRTSLLNELDKSIPKLFKAFVCLRPSDEDVQDIASFCFFETR
jgi:hypothetical protein